MMFFMSDYVEQCFVVLMSSFFAATTTIEVAEESEESVDFEPDGIYVAHVDDPLPSSGDEFDHDEE